MSNVFRKEIKYTISDNDFHLINHNMKNIIKIDDHCENGHYTISSIYFDTYNKTSYRQVKDGISDRWKYRIRFYDYKDTYIKLEKKHKVNNLTNKTSIRISKKELKEIMNNTIKIKPNNPPLLNEFILKMNTELLKPIIFIEYDRIPYIYKLGNVRITLDYDIRYTNKFNNLFSKNKKMHYLEDKVLEVKYNELIPDFVRFRLELNHLEQVSFSKFNNCIESLNRRF